MATEELEHSTLQKYEATTNTGGKYKLLKDIESNRIYLVTADSPDSLRIKLILPSVEPVRTTVTTVVL